MTGSSVIPPINISIVIPTYNSGDMVEDCIESCLKQSWTDFEVVVVDDASTDDTVERAKSFCDERVRVVVNEVNLGLIGNWNRCIRESSGEWVLILHHDDWLFQGALEKLAFVSSLCPDVGVVMLGGFELPGPDADARHKCSQDRRFAVTPAGYESLRLLFSSGVYCSAVAVRREVYEQIGTFDPTFSYSSDEEMWPRIAANFAMAVCHSPSVGVRSTGEHHMHVTWEKQDFWEQWLCLHERIKQYIKRAEVEENLQGDCRGQLEVVVEKKLIDTTHYIASQLLLRCERRLARKFIEYVASYKTVYRRPRKSALLTVLSYLPNGISRSVTTYLMSRGHL